MNGAHKWCWLKHAAHLAQQDGESIRENVYRNGYMRAKSLEGARSEIARRAGVDETQVQLQENGE
jgi:hypothetical protein